jgi:hypothetical protein
MKPYGAFAPLISGTMRRYALWILWLTAIAALLGATRARMQPASEADACNAYIYWESPLLK